MFSSRKFSEEDFGFISEEDWGLFAEDVDYF